MSRNDVIIRVALFAGLASLALLSFPGTESYDVPVDVGDFWLEDDIVAPFDFSIRLPEEEIATRRDSVYRMQPPVFQVRSDALAQTLARLDSVDARLDSAFVAYADWRDASQRLEDSLQAGPDVSALRRAMRRDSAAYAASRDAMSLALTSDQWDLLARSSYEAALGASRSATLDDRLLGEAARIAREALGRGVLSVPKDSVQSETLLARDLSTRTETEINRNAVLGQDEVRVRARMSLTAAFPSRPDTVAIAASLFRSVLEPSLVYDADATERTRRQALESVLPTQGQVRQGQVVIRRGDEVTAEVDRTLQSLYERQRERSGTSTWSSVTTLLGRLLLVLSALALFFLYMYLLRPTVFADSRRFTLACLIVGMVLLGFIVATFFGGAAEYVVPVALASILLTIVFDSRVGSFATLTLATIGGLVTGYDFPYAFTTLIVGVLAVFSVRDVKNRSQILASAGLVGLAYGIVLLGFELLRADPFGEQFVAELGAAGANAALILLAAPLLWGMERVFGVTTDMTLLELSDTNRPLLKKLSMQAPGTFNHSLQVANLAEAAADTIGANALRARVGALYHDIGKMLKPEYFIENQQPDDNPHERIKPSMSSLVIAAHVKEGVQLGREQNLPSMVVDFIASHHGTGLIEFFYRKAQEESEDPDTIDESDYRYPGPRPRTNEQAIVMLADSVEAASRSLDKPTPKRLEALINGIVAARLADGQLDESPLTFSDVSQIKETFHTLLCGIYHFRVKYPDQDDQGDGDASASLEVAPGVPTDDPAGESATPEERSTLG
ncbi:HD family phosphohydrolase [Rubrivirga sp.]|uniref:HD family phosphohydrolase n=1 Tax=Rubrivirga sp. TaxID=1885344 RepID=UPI003C759462